MKAKTVQFFNSRIGMIQRSMKNYVILSSVFLFQVSSVLSQSQTYDNFDGSKFLHYGDRSGVLDTAARNPAISSVDSTVKCAKYVRNGAKKFDNIKMLLSGKLLKVENYTTYTGIPPKLSMKIYTTAPVGTLIEILLGSRGRNNEYPAGTNSQFQAYTTVSNAWEVVDFKFSQIPQGSETSSTEIDQITLLFAPNTLNSDTYYFDDITGPPVSDDKLESGSLVNFPKSGSKK